jgi:serine/threonine protein phosphatase PrpC
MCSDGLWSELEDGELAEVLADRQPDQACRELLDRVLGRDCSDNVSIQVIRVLSVAATQDERGASRNGWLSSIFQRGRVPGGQA